MFYSFMVLLSVVSLIAQLDDLWVFIKRLPRASLVVDVLKYDVINMDPLKLIVVQGLWAVLSGVFIATDLDALAILSVMGWFVDNLKIQLAKLEVRHVA